MYLQIMENKLRSQEEDNSDIFDYNCGKKVLQELTCVGEKLGVNICKAID